MDEAGHVALSIFKGLAGFFAVLASLVTAIYVIYKKGYKGFLYQLFLCLILSTALSGLAFLLQSFIVNYVVWISNSTTDGNDELSIALCSISRIPLYYTNWFNVLVITVITVWLLKASLNSNKIRNKPKHSSKTVRIIGFSIIILVPLLSIISPIIQWIYNLNQNQYCIPMTIDNATTHSQKVMNSIFFLGFGLWYGMTFLILGTDTVLLLYCVIKFCWKLKMSHFILLDQHKAILKDSLRLSAFVFILYSLYCFELICTLCFDIWIANYAYMVWGIQGFIIIARSIAILVMFFNSRMRLKMKLMPYVKHSVPLLNEDALEGCVDVEPTTPSDYGTLTSSTNSIMSSLFVTN